MPPSSPAASSSSRSPPSCCTASVAPRGRPPTRRSSSASSRSREIPAVTERTRSNMMDLATYTPMGDKKNSDFFEEYLPRVYERRQKAGLDQIVGNTAALVVQVEHGDGIDYLAELTAMGPYRFAAARLGETHRIYVLVSRPEFPRMI